MRVIVIRYYTEMFDFNKKLFFFPSRQKENDFFY